jgi:hypothetical protein
MSYRRPGGHLSPRLAGAVETAALAAPICSTPAVGQGCFSANLNDFWGG